MDLQLSGLVAVVTGASKGIGLATTRTLLEEGTRLVAVSRSTSKDLEELACSDLVHAQADLMNPQAPAEVVTRAVEAFGRLDVLINNAGGAPPGTRLPRFGFAELTDDDWRRMFELNLYSAVRSIRAALPAMLAGGGGAVVNVSSGHAHQPSGVNVDYGAAKAAMNNLTQALSEEFAPQGIRVNTVSPGPVRTAWWTDEGGAADILAEYAGTDRDSLMDTVAPQMMNLTTGRLVDPQEVADVVVQLASPRSASTTGSDVVVDAGWLKAV